MYPFHRKRNDVGNTSGRHFLSGKTSNIRRDENGEATLDFDEKFHYRQKTPQGYYEKEISTLTEKENILKMSILGNDLLESKEKQNIPLGNLEELHSREDNSLGSTSSSPRTLNSNRSHSRGDTSDKFKGKVDENYDKIPDLSENCLIQNISDEQEYSNKKCSIDSFTDEIHKSPIKTFKNLDQEMTSDFTKLSKISKIITEEINLSASIADTNESEINKINESSNQTQNNQWQTHMKRFLQATCKNVNEQWLGEAFIFGNRPASYGLTQGKEGCCGVLTAVNAFVIKELLFGGEMKNEAEFLRPYQSQLQPALIGAMTEILWQAGESKARLAILEKSLEDLKSIEDVIDKAQCVTHSTKSDLHSSIAENILRFTEPGSHGCILFLISVILSRGVERVLEDMNGVPSLITANGFSTLEMVNLILSGMAVSNVFDNHMKLQQVTIKGIPKRSSIGYLSIKEHFKFCKVGSYLKTPKFPIWLIHNENLFTILFSCQKQLLSDWKAERKFILTYFDPFKNKGREIRLSIDTTKSDEANGAQENFKTLVENCLRTKWKDANITWK